MVNLNKPLRVVKSLPEKIKNVNYKEIPKRIKKTPKKKLIIIGAIIAAVILALIFGIAKLGGHKKGSDEYQTAQAERRSITRSVSASSIIEANDTYNVTALVTGEILTDTFNEGDTVKKDDVLYTIESSDVENKLTQAENSLEKARQDFTDAVKKTQ